LNVIYFFFAFYLESASLLLGLMHPLENAGLQLGLKHPLENASLQLGLKHPLENVSLQLGLKHPLENASLQLGLRHPLENASLPIACIDRNWQGKIVFKINSARLVALRILLQIVFSTTIRTKPFINRLIELCRITEHVIS
jgi:hypothetical protein